LSTPAATSSAYLVVLSGLPPRTVTLRLGTTIAGRLPGVALVLPSVEISRQHCRFEWDGERALVHDLGSTRGTFVNGVKISETTELKPGDLIVLGPVTLSFGLGEPPKDPPDSGAARPGCATAAVIVNGQPADRIPIEGSLTVGREPHCEVFLNDPSVSRRHATLEPGPQGGCVVTDLHSTAGTFINGHRFDTHGLTVGDRLQIGPFCFQYDGQSLVHIGAPRGSSVEAREVTRLIGERVLLDGISFSIAPSQFTGILGPSGAGKSTLLNAMAGLVPPDGGKVLVDGENIYAEGQPPSFGYVPQDDIVHRELTVSDALRFSARLRLAGFTPEHEIQRLLAQTMDQLGLLEHAYKPIARLSGGQRKRVSVGVELLAKPAILFLDEPSSGLDPATEFHLMELLRQLADTGCTIVCTTHVVENAYLMDQLLVLVGASAACPTAAGVLAFQGDAQAARAYFGVHKLVLLYDRLLEQTPAEWKAQHLQMQSSAAERTAAHAPAGPSVRRPPAPSRFALPILLERQWTILCADWRNFAILFGQPLIIAALVAWATTDQDLALFFTYIATLWFGCSNGAQEIVKEIQIFDREKLVGVGTHSYLLSKFLFLSITATAQGLLLLFALYAAYGGTDGMISLQLLTVLTTALAAVGLGCAISSLARTSMQAVLIVPLVLIPQILLSGFTVKASEMRKDVRAVAHLIPAFSSRALADTSFVLNRKIDANLLQNYTYALSNLNKDRAFKPGDVFTRTRPAYLAASSLVLWTIAMYLVAWRTLKKRGRR
jgi:ABC-type multidrug transport system ATPase subunit/pSer/pThr/pTyr-binding forkhead associated (FHA) protein